MKETLNIKNNNELLIERIEKKVLNAKQNAPDLELIQLKSINIKNQTEVASLLEKATITADTLFEFGLAMELLGMSKEEIQDHLAHENAHANKTEALGAQHLSYKITLVRSGNDYLFQPFAHIYIPDEWNSEKIKETMRQVTCAPEEYGNKLSPDDIEKLKNL